MRRVVAALVGFLVVFSTASFVAPAIANAAVVMAAPASHTAGDSSRSFWSLLAVVPWAIVAGWAVSVVIPYVSAKLTATPATHWTGVITAALALVDGFLSTLATQGEHLDVRAALAASFGSWVIATKWHSKVLSGTPAESNLHRTGPQLGRVS